VHQRRYQLSRPKPVLQGRFCLRASKLVLLGLLRRWRGDMHVHQRRYLKRHKLVLQGCLCLRTSKRMLWGLLCRRRGDKNAHHRRYQL